jgi:hypothetical protein
MASKTTPPNQTANDPQAQAGNGLGALQLTGQGGTTAQSNRPKGGTDLTPSAGVQLPRGNNGAAAPGV